MKYCYSCKENLEDTCFYKNKSKPNGLADECKKCDKKRNKKRQTDKKDEIKIQKQLYHIKNDMKKIRMKLMQK